MNVKNKSLKENIIKLKNQGKSYNYIKEKLGCSKGTISYHVGIGQKEKTKTKRIDGRNKIRKFIQEYKSNKRCVDCGEDYPYWILEFDHLRDKKFTIGKFSSKTISLDAIKKEIKKCEIVCANCHRNRTFNRKIKSGGSVLYDRLDCD